MVKPKIDFSLGWMSSAQKKDALIIIERGVSEPNMAKWLIDMALKDYFRAMSHDPGALERFPIGHSLNNDRARLSDYGLATEMSLTSVVLGTELHGARLDFEVIDDDDVAKNYSVFLKKRLADFKTVAISTTYTVKILTIQNLIKTIRSIDPDIPIILGGQGLSAWRLQFREPSLLLNEFEQADVLYFGEAEGVFAQLVKTLSDGKSLKKHPNTVVNDNSKPYGDWTPNQTDLDRAALPDWSILKHYSFNDGLIQRHGLPKVAPIEEGRGCSFRCKFCSYPLYSMFRRKSPERIVKELKSIENEEFESVSFVGAEFLMPLKDSKKIFEAIAKESFSLDIWSYARLDLISHNPWIADLMKAANFKYIQFGMESGDRSVLRSMGKNYDPTRMKVGRSLLKERDIEVYASIIVEYPGETADTIDKTISVLVDCNFEHVFIHALNVVPGSRLWDERDKYGIVLNALGLWSHPSMNVAEVPAHIKRIFQDLSKNTSSYVDNITQNFANLFHIQKPDRAMLLETSRALQNIVCNEWDQKPNLDMTQQRLRLLGELGDQIETIPEFLLEALQDKSP